MIGDIGIPTVFQLPYVYLPKNYRILWHQTIGKLLRYKYLPRKTMNFDLYPIYKKKTKTDVTLSSTVVTKFSGYIDDCIIKEVWTADDISGEVGFLYELLNFFNSDLDSGDYVVWFPKDKTDKAFSIEMLDIIPGDSEYADVNPKHNIRAKDYRYMVSELTFIFKIVKVVNIPEAVLLLDGV